MDIQLFLILCVFTVLIATNAYLSSLRLALVPCGGRQTSPRTSLCSLHFLAFVIMELIPEVEQSYEGH